MKIMSLKVLKIPKMNKKVNTTKNAKKCKIKIELFETYFCQTEHCLRI
jgi:hypothetical protein